MDRRMNPHRKILPILLALVTAMAGVGPASAVAPPAQPVIVHGTVASTHYPFSIVLDDGTRVELALDQGLLFADDPAAPRAGDRVVVIGHGSRANGVLTVHSAGLVAERPSGREIPLPPDPCAPPTASLDVALGGHVPDATDSTRPVLQIRGVSSASRDSKMELTGFVLSVGSQSFRIQPQDGMPLNVLVDQNTHWENLGSIADLLPGETVRVQGSYAGPDFQATSVELLGMGGGDDDGMDLTGIVLSVGSDSFELQTDRAGTVDVTVDQSTIFINLGSLSDLQAGDTVRVQGVNSGSGFLASSVELLLGGGGDDDGGGDDGGGDDGGGGGQMSGIHMEATGAVASVAPPTGLTLDDGRTFHVTTGTVYENGLTGYADIVPGQLVEIQGTYKGGLYTAWRIELEGELSGGQGFRDVEGTVTAVGSTSLSIDGGLVVLVMPITIFDGDADHLAGIQVGWKVEVHALLNMMGQLVAMEIRSDNPAPATTEDQRFEPRQALVVLADTADPAEVASRYGARVAGIVDKLGYLFRWEHTELTDELLAWIAADADVLAIEPNYLFRDPESSRKRFPVVDRSPTVEKYLQQAATTEIELPAALALADGTGTVVAVLDTGVEPCQPLIESRLLPGGMDVVDGDLEPWETRDGVDEDGDGYIDEAAGHGTFVASIIALVAPGARILPYRVLDDDGGGTAYGLALALADAIDRGVDVINISLTYHTRSTVVDLLLERAAERGIVVVAAAGNDPTTTLPFPAVDSHVLAVTAMAADGNSLASFASTSLQPPIVAAPGEDVYGALDRGRYGLSTGTSMAAPFAAGAAALVKSMDKGIDPALVQQAIVQGGAIVGDGSWGGTMLDVAATLGLVGP